ncbi:MAG: hypothetical protein GXY82_00010 [Methanospirillum sp.]|nr:hypothetical protein [Methanospirillum sp.]
MSYMEVPEASPARVPRGTCKLFGAIKAIGTIRKSAVLVHGPRGCVYHINYILGMRGDRPSEVYTTALDEHDVIFGSEDRLREAIEYLDRALCPELIFVLSCCASEIIGEDVACASREASTGARVVAIAAGGFEGDFHDGYSETLRQLVDQLARATVRVDPLAVNLVGMLRAGPDLEDLRQLLSLTGARVNAVLTAGASLAELERLSDAALNIVVCEPSGTEAARRLEDRFGTPWIVEEFPMGQKATTGFLERVARALGLPAGTSHLPAEEVPDLKALREKRIAIVSGPTRAVAVTRLLAAHGALPRLVAVEFDPSVRERIERMLGSAGEVLIEPDHERIVEKLREHGIDLLIGGMLELPVARSLGIGHVDVMHGSQRTVGVPGAENLLRLLCRAAREVPTPSSQPR